MRGTTARRASWTRGRAAGSPRVAPQPRTPRGFADRGPPRSVGADKHGPHPRRLARRVESARVAFGVAATRVEPIAPAPAAAGDQLAAALEHEVRPVREQHRID